MAFSSANWTSVDDELPEKDFVVLLACMLDGVPFLAIGYLVEIDDEGFTHFYTISHGWVDVLYWQELPIHPEIYEDF